MELIVVYATIITALFVASLFAKRRFGLLGLALAAGSLLSSIWGYEAGLVAGFFGFRAGPLTDAVATSLLVLLPAGVLLLHGYTYKSLLGRIIGAALFTLLAMAFLVEPLSHVLIAQGQAAGMYSWLLAHRTSIIGVGLVAAVADLFLTKPVHLSGKHHKH